MQQLVTQHKQEQASDIWYHKRTMLNTEKNPIMFLRVELATTSRSMEG